MQRGRERRAGSHASRAGKPLKAVAASRDSAPFVRAQLCPGTVCVGTRLCRGCPGAPRAPDTGVHDNAVPPCLTLGGGATMCEAFSWRALDMCVSGS